MAYPEWLQKIVRSESLL